MSLESFSSGLHCTSKEGGFDLPVDQKKEAYCQSEKEGDVDHKIGRSLYTDQQQYDQDKDAADEGSIEEDNCRLLQCNLQSHTWFRKRTA